METVPFLVGSPVAVQKEDELVYCRNQQDTPPWVVIQSEGDEGRLITHNTETSGRHK